MDSIKNKLPLLEKNFDHSSFKEFEKFDQDQPNFIEEAKIGKVLLRNNKSRNISQNVGRCYENLPIGLKKLYG